MSLVKGKRQKGRNINGEIVFPEVSAATELFSSFYLDDILKVKDHPTDSIKRYVSAMNDAADTDERVQIDIDTAQMNKWLTADKYPLGIWPSVFSPCLMQQLGINLAISDEQPIFSVNGPPGTGKTTLLKEIIVSNIINRAIAMSSYDTPDAAFTMHCFSNPPDQYNIRYYIPSETLTLYGIIVASNNNAAVENISMELPKKIKKDRTGCFTNESDVYFADIASALIEDEAWGLISAKLGKKSNVKKLVECLWWSKDCKTLRACYEDTENIPDWNQAKKEFKAVLADVMAERNKIAEGQKLLDEIREAKSEMAKLQQSREELHTQLAACNAQYEKEKNALNELEALEKQHRSNILMLTDRLGPIKKLLYTFFANDPLVAEWRRLEEELNKALLQKISQNNKLSQAKKELNAAESRVNNAPALLSKLESKLTELEEKLKPFTERFGETLPSDGFWDNIEKNEEAQSISPWTDAAYDALRETLFYKALMLHKAFVLNSNAVRQNLMRLFAMWEDTFTERDRKKAVASLMNTLMLVIPVISTTFASVQSFLGDVDAGMLGTLVIDEAGQATPQSALGALWRTRKAIIVGDPLQVEPILTVPRELQIRLADENNIPSVYRMPELSVQMLGDRLNQYGGVRILEGQELWLGCPLVLHRRCIEPMFSISNEIAYNGRMFIKTAEPKDAALTFEKSVWLDIKGTMQEKGNQNVKEQNEAAIKLFEMAMQQHSDLPDIYIISPFKRIAYDLRHRMAESIQRFHLEIDSHTAEQWAAEHCGTIHTFQGKEAKEVILVLGCDSAIGAGAARWVGQKPNIVNVAVSRAKYRICVIGDYSLWSKIPNVQTVCRLLPIEEAPPEKLFFDT